MKILLDPQIFIYQKFGGISRYYTEIYKELKEKKNVKISCPLVYTENLHLKEYSFFNNKLQDIVGSIEKFSFSIGKKIKEILKKRSIAKTIQLIKRQDFDLFVPTFYDPYFLNHLGPKPFVLTVYDMIDELFPKGSSYDSSIVAGKKLLIEKATKIISISECTKRDILRIYPHIEPSKIEVVYLGFTISMNGKPNFELPEKYILFVGNRKDYKNFIFFIKAVAPLMKNESDLHLLCAGGNTFTVAESDLINELGLANRVIQQNFKDNELGHFYKKAICFVFPSEYEGFGIPVLESMACGCPVVLPYHSSFPEVAGNAGVFFELNNGNDLKEKVEDLLKDKTLRAQYSLKGLEQVKKFSWKKCTEDIYNVYLSVINT